MKFRLVESDNSSQEYEEFKNTLIDAYNELKHNPPMLIDGLNKDLSIEENSNSIKLTIGKAYRSQENYKTYGKVFYLPYINEIHRRILALTKKWGGYTISKSNYNGGDFTGYYIKNSIDCYCYDYKEYSIFELYKRG